MRSRLLSIRSKVASATPSPLLNLLVRAASLIANFRRSWSGLRQIDLDALGAGPRILIIGPGEKRIPVTGWGAVELVIAKQISDLREHNFQVDLLNSWNPIDWLTCFVRKPQVVICHYDVFAHRARLFSKVFTAKCITVTHYAYAQQPNRWDSQFGRYARQIGKSDFFVALNESIAKVFSELYPKLPIRVIANGIDVSRMSADGKHEGAICLGKIEPRKRQIAIAQQLTGDENIRFVGDIVDPNFWTLKAEQQSLFLGPWTREQVESRLGNYSTLFLLGDGEADALVLYEAQAAGLEVLTNELSAGSQNRKLPWVRVVPPEDELSQLLSSAKNRNSPHTPEEIAAHAVNNYDSKSSNNKYAALMRELI